MEGAAERGQLFEVREAGVGSQGASQVGWQLVLWQHTPVHACHDADVLPVLFPLAVPWLRIGEDRQKPGIGQCRAEFVLEDAKQDGLPLSCEAVVRKARGKNQVGEVTDRVHLRNNLVKQFGWESTEPKPFLCHFASLGPGTTILLQPAVGERAIERGR